MHLKMMQISLQMNLVLRMSTTQRVKNEHCGKLRKLKKVGPKRLIN